MFKSGAAKPNGVLPAVLVPGRDARDRSRPTNGVKDAAARQREKIRQIGKALGEAGFVTIAEQARAIGLSRSTTWKILQADHKSSGLHAGLISRMLTNKALPPAVRAVLREYIIEKARGQYGHNQMCRRRFAAYFWDMPEMSERGACADLTQQFLG